MDFDAARDTTTADPAWRPGASAGKRALTDRLPGPRRPTGDAPAGSDPAPAPAPRHQAGGDDLTLLGLTEQEWHAVRQDDAARGAHGRRAASHGDDPAARPDAGPATVDDATRAAILGARGDLTVAVYPEYQDGVRDAAQFARSATSYATNYRALAVVAGRLVVGAPIMIHRLTEAQTGIAAVGAALRAIDPALRIHNVALFAHGEPSGMGLSSDNDFHLHATRDRPRPRRGATPGPEHAENAPLAAADQTFDPSVIAFRDAIRSSVSADVRFQLFGCSTGRDQGVAQNDMRHWQGHGEGDRWGTDSFAQELADAFGPDASSYAHATYGHATENSASLVFGRDAGGGRGGVHLFEQMYPRAFIEAETRDLLGAAADDAALFAHNYRYLRDRMHSHWMARVNPDHISRSTHQMTHAHLNLPAEGPDRSPRPLGQEMFARPAAAATALQADWRAHREDFVHPWRPVPLPAPRRGGHGAHAAP